METKWEQVLVSWMNGKSVEFQVVPDGTTEVISRDDFQITELEKLLLDQALMPEFLCGNNDLYMVLLRRMQLQLMYSISVPPRRDETTCTFGGLLNSRRQILNEIRSSLDKSMLHLEKKNGVNLAYYWKIPVKEKQMKEAKQVGVQHDKRVKKRGIYSKKIFTKFAPTDCQVRMVLSMLNDSYYNPEDMLYLLR